MYETLFQQDSPFSYYADLTEGPALYKSWCFGAEEVPASSKLYSKVLSDS